MKSWSTRIFGIMSLILAYLPPAWAGRPDVFHGQSPMQLAAKAEKFQNVLWVISFISLLLPTFIFEKRERDYTAKQVSVPLKHLVLHPAVITTFAAMVSVYAVFMAVDFYSPCAPKMWFVYSYILAGILWLAMVQPAWIYFTMLKVEKFYITKSHSPEFYENNRPLFDRWAKWMAFGVAVFFAAISLASFYYMDRLNWSNCQQAH